MRISRFEVRTAVSGETYFVLRAANGQVVATGDSYNDISMLRQANAGFLFQPSEKVTRDHPDLPVANTYEELKAMFARHID